MWNSTAFSEKRSESRSTRSMQKYQYFEWGSTLNLDGFKIIIFQYIICEPFRSWKEGLVKLNVNLRNLAKIQMSPKHFRPPLFYDNFLWPTNFAYYRALWKKILKWLVFKYSFLSLTIDLTFGFGVVTNVFGVNIGARTFYKCSTKNLEAKPVCFFELLHCLVCWIQHQRPDKGSQENMPFLAQTYQYIFICIFGIFNTRKVVDTSFQS